MADTNRTQPRADETSDTGRDQAAERERLETEQNRGFDEATRARKGEDEEFEDIDPDSAESDIDRDDTIDEP